MLSSPADLIKDREDLQQKVAAIQAQKNQDIETRVLSIQTNREETKKLEELLGEANKNLEYYVELNESGQFPADEQENFEKAKRLIEEIKAKIAEHDEAAKSAMAITKVKEKVMDKAGKINESVNEKKAEKEKKAMMEEKFSQWFNKLVNQAEELSNAQAAELLNCKKASDNLLKKVEENINDDAVKNGLRIELARPFINIREFKQQIAQYKKSLGLIKISEKRKADLLINSSELKEMEGAISRLNKFIEKNNLGGRVGRDVHGSITVILSHNTNGMVDELESLVDLSGKKPYANPIIMIEAVYEKLGISEKTSLKPREIYDYYGRRHMN